MVVPLKLTQFYGHKVPRPRIYADVKFSEQRVDPPPSVNEALLSWASDAHWSLGGLSFKRLRAQGKVEGSVRRLRAFIDDEEIKDDRKGDGDKMKTASMKAVNGPDENKKQLVGEESVQDTPVRKSRRKTTDAEQGDGGSPIFVPATVDPPVRRSKRKFPDAEEDDGGSSPLFVPATVEKQQKNLRSKVGDFPLSPASEKHRIRRGISISDDGNEGRSLPVNNVVKLPSSKVNNGSFETPLAKGIARKVMVMRQDHGTKSAVALEVGQDKRLSRSATKAAPVVLPAPSSPSQLPAKQHTTVPKKLLLRSSDNDSSSESDDGLEAFLKQKGRPLRRSMRMVKQSKPLPLPSDSEGDSD